MTHHEDFLAGRSTEDKEFFAVHGYWPNEEPAKDGKA
jgi:ribonuclease I